MYAASRALRHLGAAVAVAGRVAVAGAGLGLHRRLDVPAGRNNIIIIIINIINNNKNIIIIMIKTVLACTAALTCLLGEMI